jgi:4-amino-4-deoxy-L-arabinose transferase-like glycosyltransferase
MTTASDLDDGPAERDSGAVPVRAEERAEERAGDPAEEGPRAVEAVPAPDPAWTRPALAGLLVLTAVGYLWDLGRNGWGNTFYAAAVQAGTKSWKAFFFGSFDSSNYITVDKPPVSLWIMELSGRVFGFNAWSMLVPEALLGVASVWLLFAAVRRVWGAPAGLLAGALLALTPAAALMFRFNNPDAALTFLLVATAYTLTRAVERGSTRWLLGTAVLLGSAFLAKELQALLVLPALAAAYLVAAPVGLGRRILQLLAAGGALVVSGLWWPVLVDAIPAASRPYIGGSTSNSVIQLALGYNGLGRITGQDGGPGGGSRVAPAGGAGFTGAPGVGAPGVGAPGFGAAGPAPGGVGPVGGGPGGGGGFGGTAGIGRMANEQFGGFIAWWLPAALIGLLAAAWLIRRSAAPGRGRTDPRWASLILWGGWTLVTAGIFSFASGIVHTYYTIALAPGVAALSAMTLPGLWRRRSEPVARLLLAGISAATTVTAFLLLGRAAGWLPWLRWSVLVLGLVAAAGLALAGNRVPLGGRRTAAGIAAAALAAGVAGPLAWSLATIGSTHTGSIPTAGPASAQAAGFGAGGRARGQFPGDGQGPGSGPGSAETADTALTALLRSGTAGYTWVAASSSSMTAGPLQLASDAPVMSIGGFGGNDQAITLDTFKAYVAAKKIHYYVTGGQGGFGGRGGGPEGGSSAISAWVQAGFTATTVGGSTVYDLTEPVS